MCWKHRAFSGTNYDATSNAEPSSKPDNSPEFTPCPH